MNSLGTFSPASVLPSQGEGREEEQEGDGGGARQREAHLGARGGLERRLPERRPARAGAPVAERGGCEHLRDGELCQRETREDDGDGVAVRHGDVRVAPRDD